MARDKTGTLEARRWTGALIGVTRDYFSDTFSDIFPGVMASRDKVGTLNPRRWEGILS